MTCPNLRPGYGTAPAERRSGYTRGTTGPRCAARSTTRPWTSERGGLRGRNVFFIPLAIAVETRGCFKVSIILLSPGSVEAVWKFPESCCRQVASHVWVSRPGRPLPLVLSVTGAVSDVIQNSLTCYFFHSPVDCFCKVSIHIHPFLGGFRTW